MMGILKRAASLPAVGLGLSLGIAPAHATGYWEYKDWSVAVEERITEEHDWLDCSAWTGGDGMPTLRMKVTRDDVGPPESFPQLQLNSVAPRGHSTQMVNGQAVGFIVDQKVVFYGLAHTDINEEGLQETTVRVRWDNALEMIKWMQSGTHLDAHMVRPYDGGIHLMRASLAGFTAAYGKMMDECGFSLELQQIEIDYN
ncbi:hypothetical protein RSK20926_14846 [Roseobacter sp. SK209-2-6]|nr:hypothetical protein RSK20926_14846 [Roseobacter sp. SK209-2-6]